MDLETLQKRSEIIKQIRSFFSNRGYLELDTPLLADNLIPESCLEVFQTERLFPFSGIKKNSPMWLIPSPEVHMKKIIAKHKTDVFQICKCFRNGEQTGHLHNSEFTMLEYYTMGANYLDSLALTEELFSYLNDKGQGTMDKGRWPCTKVNQNIPSNDCKQQNCSLLTAHCSLNSPLPPFYRITVKEAFKRYAGFDLFKAAEDPKKMETEARRLGLDPMPGLDIPALYDLIFIHAVEPHLKKDKPAALTDYPAFVPCLAKKAKDGDACGATVERWELYYNGIELANCFTEETNPQEVKDFFIKESAQKEKTALVKHKVDHDYWQIFKDFPECSGVALGVDRLIMALLGKSAIDSVIII